MSKEIIEEKEAKSPSKAEIEFSKTLEGKVVDHINKCIEKKKALEAYLFSWALIEQILLKKLIKFIAKNLKVKIPMSLWKSNQFAINNFYLAISHDQDLYINLEKGRKDRNKMLHQLVKTHVSGEMRGKLVDLLRHNLLNLIFSIFERLSGTIPIPSLGLYAKGWNDCRDQMQKNIEKLAGD